MATVAGRRLSSPCDGYCHRQTAIVAARRLSSPCDGYCHCLMAIVTARRLLSLHNSDNILAIMATQLMLADCCCWASASCEIIREKTQRPTAHKSIRASARQSARVHALGQAKVKARRGRPACVPWRTDARVYERACGPQFMAVSRLIVR